MLSPQTFYLFNVNNRNTRKRCEIYSKLTTKIPERRQRHSSGVFVVNFEPISHLFIVFLLLTSNKLNVCWGHTSKKWEHCYEPCSQITPKVCQPTSKHLMSA